jgi:phosphoribosylformylglycinamidine cyclo-ligase
VVVAPEHVAEATRLLTQAGETVHPIGTLRARVGDEAQSQVRGW